MFIQCVLCGEYYDTNKGHVCIAVSVTFKSFGMRSKNWRTNHGADIPPIVYPMYDVIIPGLGYGLKSRPGEPPEEFASRLADALLSRGQGSEWQCSVFFAEKKVRVIAC